LPRTKLGEAFSPKKKRQLTLAEVPDLPTTLSIEQAAEVIGIGYSGIKELLDTGKLPCINSGTRRVIPTWEFIVKMQLLPESLMERVYLDRVNLQKGA
jgi:excisionase family DNA binding protein